MVISVGNHPPESMSPLANDLPSSITLWHLFHIVHDTCLWASCYNPLVFLNPSLPNAWLQNVISPSQVHTSCWRRSLWGSLHLSPSGQVERDMENTIGGHICPWLPSVSPRQATAWRAGARSCHSLGLSLDLKWTGVALQHCRPGNEAFFAPVFCKASRQ